MDAVRHPVLYLLYYSSRGDARVSGVLGMVKEFQPTIPHVIVAGLALQETKETFLGRPLSQEPEQFFV
jgi:hypothetical protein